MWTGGGACDVASNKRFSMTEEEIGTLNCLRNGVLKSQESFRRRSRALLLVTRDGKTRADAADACESSVRSVFNVSPGVRKSPAFQAEASAQ